MSAEGEACFGQLGAPHVAPYSVARLLDDSSPGSGPRDRRSDEDHPPRLGVDLERLAGSAVDRPIEHARIQKSGLALAGHFHGIVPTRVQILGQTELSYLHSLSREARRERLSGFFSLGLSCVVVTRAKALADGAGGESPERELVEEADRTQTPLLLSSDRSSVTITALHALLDDRLAPRVRLHGVLIDVFGVGVLLIGSSGIGKSESALDLVMRGHRLVADDVVDCDYRPPGAVFGGPAPALRHHLEVRGLGILNIKDLFGVTSVRKRKRIDVIVRLVEWSTDTAYDRLGLDDHYREVLGVSLPELIIPVRPGRDMASILEVAARNELSKSAGHHGAREFFSQFGDTSAAPDAVQPRSGASTVPPARVSRRGAPPDDAGPSSARSLSSRRSS